MQVLDARHVELFLEEGFKDGSWEYEDIGSHRIAKQSIGAAGAIFDSKHLPDPSTAGNARVVSVALLFLLVLDWHGGGGAGGGRGPGCKGVDWAAGWLAAEGEAVAPRRRRQYQSTAERGWDCTRDKSDKNPIFKFITMGYHQPCRASSAVPGDAEHRGGPEGSFY